MFSKSGKINFRQFIKGIVVSIFGAILTGLTQGLQENAIEPKTIAITGAVAGLSYIGTALSSNSKGELFKGEPKKN